MGAPIVNNQNQTDSVQPASSSETKDTISIDRVFALLSIEEIEIAARSSYRYLVSSTNGTASNEDRDRHAKAMVSRYLQVEQKLHGSRGPEEWETAALEKMKRTLEFRVEKNVDEIRLCFAKENIPSKNDEEKKSDDGDDKMKTFARIREGLEDRFKNGASVVRGYNKDGGALFLNFPRADTEWEEEFYIKGNIYSLERALACTEKHTNGEKDRVIVVYEYSGYAMKNSPPPLLVKRLLYNLRDHWPERLDRVFIVDAPFAFRVFWTVIKHFIDPITKELVQFITGDEMKKQVFSEIVDEDNAAPWMFAEGKNGGDADFKKYFYDIPFDQCYAEN